MAPYSEEDRILFFFFLENEEDRILFELKNIVVIWREDHKCRDFLFFIFLMLYLCFVFFFIIYCTYTYLSFNFMANLGIIWKQDLNWKNLTNILEISYKHYTQYSITLWMKILSNKKIVYNKEKKNLN